MEKRLKDEYYISEYVITKNDNSVRGIFVSKERFNPDKPEYFLVVYSYRERGNNKKIGFPKRSQRKHLLLRLMSTKNVVSAEIGKERVKDIYKDYLVFRCNVEKADFEILNKLRVRLKDYEAEDHFDEFFKEYERG